MKKLQNNFTTPEQSKRLLELGVPEWTADLRYRICKVNDSILGNPYLTKGKKYTGSHFNSSLPCWSVGRLIEILKECINNEDELIDIFVELQYSNNLLTTVLMIFRDNKAILDFSKLEE